MKSDVTNLLSKLDTYKPLKEYTFGHTPLQMSVFKTTQQQGCETYEYWHQVLQLRSLKDSLEELNIQSSELADEINNCKSIWPIWSRKKRQKRIPRLEFQLKKITRSISEKSREAEFHYKLLQDRYKHLENLSEAEILEKDKDYWIHRLRKQLAISQLSRKLGVGEGELSAIVSLPLESRQKILQGIEENKFLLKE